MRGINHPTSKIALISGLFLLLFTTVPLSAEAKVNRAAGFVRDKGTQITVSQPLGWPITVAAGTNVRGTVQSLPGMAVVRLQAYKPWYKFFSKVPSSTDLTISGLPKETLLHIYTDGYRTHTQITTDANGRLYLERPTGRGMQIIIKDKPSTKHIAIDPLFGPPGGDCEDIGSWNATTLTCTLTNNVSETISIEDDGIVLDGAGHSISGGGSGDGIYTDVSGVTTKNISVSNFARGVVYADSFFTHAAGGEASDLTLSNNTINFAIDGVPSIILTGSALNGGNTGLSIVDQLDSFPTDNISITGNTLSGGDTALFADGVSATLTRNNFKGNTTDVASSGSNLILTGGTLTRGNFWSKFASCTQDVANPSHCTNSYDPGPATDTLPWACENGWTRTCPIAPSGGGGSGGGSPFPSFRQNDLRWASNIYDSSDIHPVKCGATSNNLNLGIRSCGCVITSIINILHSYGISKDIDNKEIDPGILDDWLTLNTGYNKDGDLIWSKVDEFVKNRTSNNNIVIFEYGGFAKKDNLTQQQIFDLLDTKLAINVPAIAMAFDGSHFFVIYGKENNRYKVRDSSWYETNYLDESGPRTTTVRPYNNQLGGVHTYKLVSRNTSLKSIMIVLGSPADIIITDPNGKKVGNDPINNIKYREIIGAAYWAQSFIDPELLSLLTPDDSKYIWIPDPISGDYKVELFGTGTGAYDLAVSSYNQSDESFPVNHSGQINNNQIISYTLSYDLNGATTISQPLKNNGETKVTICHIPPGNHTKAHTITVGYPALKAHLAHGDKIGACSN